MENQENYRPSGLHKFAGTEETKFYMSKYFQRIFQEDAKKFLEKEKTKTEQERQLINELIKEATKFTKKYGAIPIQITPEHIHLIDKEQLSQEEKERLKKSKTSGAYQAGSELVVMLWSQNEMENIKTLIHELIHFHSFQSATIKIENKEEKLITPEIRRVGLTIKTKDGSYYFDEINEAITEELVKRFYKTNLKNISSLQDLLETRKQLILKFSKNLQDDIAYCTTDKKINKITAVDFSYSKERKKLWKIINDIYEKHKNSFNNTEEIFLIFAKAVFSGKLIEIAHLIEETYGDGSFRVIGKKSQKRQRKSL